LALLVATAVLYKQEKSSDIPIAGSTSVADFASGLSYSFIATCGTTMAAMFRKQLSALNISSAEQVGVATLIQGFGALVYCNTQGLSLGQFVTVPAFVIPAVGSSVLNALTKTLETRAYHISEVSLCAPFLAFDPVMQFLLPVLFAPTLCSIANFACDEAKTNFPTYHPTAVGCVAIGAFLLKFAAARDDSTLTSASDQNEKKKKSLRPRQHIIAGLPLGAWYILFNCCIYAITSRLDKAAITHAGKALYFAYGRVVMASTCFAGARPTKATLSKFTHPHTAILILCVCVSETFYLLALYQAFATISPVYVTAIKRGGGLLFSAVASALLFRERIKSRIFPILTIVAGVVFLCL